jgi:hypothetical protein
VGRGWTEPVGDRTGSSGTALDALTQPFDPDEGATVFPMGLVILIAMILAPIIAILLLIDARSDR